MAKKGKISSSMRQERWMAKRGTLDKIVDNRLKKYAEKQGTKRARSSEYYKTKRSAARSAAATATVTAAEESRKKIEAEKQATRRREIDAAIIQYGHLINGEQGSANIVNPEDNSGSDPNAKTGSWYPNDTL